jgi:choline dehydrogenase-like flavoprotein
VNQGRIYTGDELEANKVVDCDVCVIGSGSGGAWLAHELVTQGLNVVMLEEGGYFTKRDFDLTESTAYPTLYQDLGNRTTEDLSISILQGRNVGGGTTVNWCSSFRTPKRILDLWRERHGVEGLDEKTLEPHFAAVERRLRIKEWPADRMNRNNQVLWDGLGKLGYARGLIKRNVHNCANIGYCGMGCPIDAKQSMGVTLIPDAVEKGLTVFANTSARTLQLDGRKATAVQCEVFDPRRDAPSGRKLTVRAKATALCCGAINSPALLLRSGVDGGGQVGKRTFLHPVVVMAAMFEEPIQAFAGAPQSVYSHHFADRGTDRMGFFIEAAPVHPMLAATALTGFGTSHQDLLEKLPFLHASIALTIDGLHPEEEGGTVELRDEGYGRIKINYPLTERHFEAFRVACKEMAKVQFAAGAKKVISLHYDPVTMTSAAEVAKLDAARWEKLRVRVMTAHQMGGCAMGKDPETSVVSSQLKVHDYDNLFVVDGSVFPTSLGVNPQETIFALARWGAQHVKAAV